MAQNSKSAERLFRSVQKETRLCVLECAVFIEEKVSDTLGRILGIEWRKSTSLGYGSGSLGIDYKIKLIQDLKGIGKKREKFDTFLTIRNKFAHIAEIDSFFAYFQTISKAKTQQGNLQKWFPQINWKSENTEEIYKWAYFLLTLELFMTLFAIDANHAYEKGNKHGKNSYQEKFINGVKEYFNKTEEGNQILKEIINGIHPTDPT